MAQSEIIAIRLDFIVFEITITYSSIFFSAEFNEVHTVQYLYSLDKLKIRI